MSGKLKLKICRNADSVCLEWPVLHPERGPCRVQLPGGEVSIWPRTLQSLPHALTVDASAKPFSDVLTVDDYILKIRRAVIEAASSDVVVPVVRAGKGPTEKSAKYRVSVQYHARAERNIAPYFDEHQRYAQPQTHTLTLAVSLVREITVEGAGGTYIPAWVIRSALRDREMIRNNEYVSFPGAIWLGEQALRAQLDDALIQLSKMCEESEERRHRAQEEKAKREQLLQEQRERMAREDEVRRERAARKKRPVRAPDQRVENCRVEWVSWFRRDGNFQKQEHAAEPCVVEHYGKKIVIHTPDGQKISKLQGPNLKIMPRTVESPTPEQLG